MDPDGEQLVRWLKSRKVSEDFLQIDQAHPTGIVRVLPGPRYEIADSSAWDFIEFTDSNRSAATGAGAVVFGTLAQRQPSSRATIRALVKAARGAGVPSLCDLNLREPYFDEETVLWSLRNCDLLKLNREELAAVSRLLHAYGETEQLFSGLLREFGISRGVLTLGADGSLLCEDGDIRHQPAEKADRFRDSVGAGDAFTAVLAVALARGTSLSQAGSAASALAAFVVSEPGAAPEIPQILAERVNAVLCA